MNPEFDETRPETYPCAQPGGDCGCTGTGLISCPGRSTEDHELNGLTAEQYRAVMARVAERMEAETTGPLPPATDSPAPSEETNAEAWPGLSLGELHKVAAAAVDALSPATRPGTVPCEVCSKGVTTAYVARTGRARHGHHPENV
jgi:hypothetical protein